MTDYTTLQDKCRNSSEMFSRMVEEFLFRNVVNHKKFTEEVKSRFAPYRHVTAEFKDGWLNMMMMQHLTHGILKKGGLLKGYLKHSAVQRLTGAELDYLQFLAEHPWRFSFSIITGNPTDNFYEMEDVFTDESFLIYSPGIGDILKERQVSLWFNLIGFNGGCWQSYGPIAAYQAFTSDDIFFYATELNPRKIIENNEDIMKDVENNPVPYMMLLSGSNYPLIVHKEDVTLQVMADYSMDEINTKGFEKDFTIEYSKNVYRFALKRWSGYPHFSAAFYDESRKVFRLYSMTDRGFSTLVDRLSKLGFDLEPEPEIRLTMAMGMTIHTILKMKILLNDYDSLFKKDEPAEEKENMDRLNHFLSLAIPEINAGRKPDTLSLARKAGVDEETANSILKHFMDKLDQMKK